VEPTVQTDRTIANSKPDIILRNDDKGTRVLINAAIYGDRNVIKSEAEKILKYKGLTVGVERTKCVCQLSVTELSVSRQSETIESQENRF